MRIKPENRLDGLYQQRKQRHKLPKPIKDHLLHRARFRFHADTSDSWRRIALGLAALILITFSINGLLVTDTHEIHGLEASIASQTLESSESNQMAGLIAEPDLLAKSSPHGFLEGSHDHKDLSAPPLPVLTESETAEHPNYLLPVPGRPGRFLQCNGRIFEVALITNAESWIEIVWRDEGRAVVVSTLEASPCH